MMGSMDEHILKTAKEITVKFIETGRVSPTGFNETFKAIYKAVEEAVKNTDSAVDEKEKK
ncbi:MAG: hypothetical protein Q8M56_13355 [Desulfobacterales bacterium]|nr:hypothetical protein [Desulfobacterales bacterium]